jgi:AcrR family transcriptional regulator
MLATMGSTLAGTAPGGGYLVAPETLLAGICRTICPRLHAGETAVAGFLEDFDAWIASYHLPNPQHGAPIHRLTDPPSSPFLPDPPLRAPKPLPPGRRVLPQGEVNRNRRERILYATAEVAASSGYMAITVDDIVARAQIARRAFYQQFADTDAAFLAALEFFAQPLVATTATAFFATRPWPERIWNSLLALLDFLRTYPSIAHAILVDSDAAAEPAARSIRATERALMLLLEEGYAETNAEPPSRITSELLLASITQLANRHLRAGEGAELPTHLPEFAAVVLAPFLGASATTEFLAGKTQSA